MDEKVFDDMLRIRKSDRLPKAWCHLSAANKEDFVFFSRN